MHVKIHLHFILYCKLKVITGITYPGRGRDPAAAVTEACLAMSYNIHMNELPLIDATYPGEGQGKKGQKVLRTRVLAVRHNAT